MAWLVVGMPQLPITEKHFSDVMQVLINPAQSSGWFCKLARKVVKTQDWFDPFNIRFMRHFTDANHSNFLGFVTPSEAFGVFNSLWFLRQIKSPPHRQGWFLLVIVNKKNWISVDSSFKQYRLELHWPDSQFPSNSRATLVPPTSSRRLHHWLRSGVWPCGVEAISEWGRFTH